MKAASHSARAVAVLLLAQVLDHKRPFDEAAQRLSAMQTLEDRDRNFVRLMVLTVLRRLGQIDALLAQCLEKPLTGKSNDVMHALRLGAVQLLWLETPPHAAVNSMVEAVSELGHEKMKGLVNAVLKRVSTEGKTILAAQDDLKLSLPAYLWESWRKAYGEEQARAIAAMRFVEPPLDLTVKDNAQSWAEKLGGVVLPTGSVRIAKAGRVDQLEGYAQGQWWVQDAAAALPVTMLGDIEGKTVLDLCAAPGGKTAQLAARGAKVIAVDQSKRRLEIVRANLDRLQLEAQLIESDVLRWKPSEPVDAILLDAPCSATGTFRRHPEVVWHRGAQEVTELADIQRRMLRRASGWLASGGIIVYCVCSLQPEEGEQQIEQFLKEHTEFAVQETSMQTLPAEWIKAPGILRTLPAYFEEFGGMDGFYAASLIKR